jgi:hypothetical protein
MERDDRMASWLALGFIAAVAIITFIATQVFK